MAMTLSQLRTFLAVTDAGSVRVAAESLLVSQPAVSAAIASLERELGVALVTRYGRGLRLTAAGTAFAADVRASLGLLDQGSRRARSIEDPARGTVRLVAVATAAERLLLPFVARFREQHPEAGVTVQVGNRMTVWETLRHHEADLVVAGRPPVAVAADTLASGENRLVLIGPASATSRRNGADAVHDPARETWLLREPGSGTRAAADALLAELDIDPPTMILGSNAAIERGVEMGLGVGLISLDAAAERISQGSVAVWACPGTPIDRPWHLVCCSGEPLGPTALALVKSMVGPGSLKATAQGRRILRSAEGAHPRPAR
ncbi:MAG: LysR family transcriptional regulator [Actinomycetota bacterium]|nr:LysR family transcriptional regulator [Actinomycetota bacterium]